MKSESDAITDDEYLLRRVHKTKLNSIKCPFVSPSSFEPRVESPTTREPDTDGISFYRESCLGSPEDCLATISREKVQDYGVVRIPVADFLGLKLSIKSSTDPKILGHVVIPEMCSGAYQTNRNVVRVFMEALARIASSDGHLLVKPSCTTLKKSESV